MIHKDDYREWKSHPVTESLMSSANDIKEQIRSMLEEDDRVMESHSRMTNYLGKIQALNGILNYRPDFNEEGFMVDENGKVIE